MSFLEIFKISRRTEISWDRASTVLTFLYCPDDDPPDNIDPEQWVTYYNQYGLDYEVNFDIGMDERDREACRWVLAQMPTTHIVYGFLHPDDKPVQAPLVDDDQLIPLQLSRVTVTQESDTDEQDDLQDDLFYGSKYQFTLTYDSVQSIQYVQISKTQTTERRRITQSLARPDNDGGQITAADVQKPATYWSGGTIGPDAKFAIGVREDTVQGADVLRNSTEMTITAWYKAKDVYANAGGLLQALDAMDPFVNREKFLSYWPGECLYTNYSAPEAGVRLQENSTTKEISVIDGSQSLLVPVQLHFLVKKNPEFVGTPDETGGYDPTLHVHSFDDGLPQIGAANGASSGFIVEGWHHVEYRYHDNMEGGAKTLVPSYRRIHVVYKKRSFTIFQLPAMTVGP